MADASRVPTVAFANSALSLPETWRFRPDLEGLRAVAVLLVLGYHAGVPMLPGGFTGVDVFFVLSGFFITGLLVKEIAQTGALSFPRFYARRARRLLPGASMVILATVVASWFVYPPLRRPAIALDAATAALNVANFRFAGVATDYLSLGQAPSPFLHFWSLAVEEQFYAFWPALVAVVAGGAVLKLVSARSLLLVAFGGIAAASFAVSIWLTVVSQPWAFFMFPTRTWQLAMGGMLALIPAELARLGRSLKGGLVVVGLVLIGLAAGLLSESTEFPGWAALLPALGAAFVVAGSQSSPAGPGALLGSRPLRALGRWSYSIYLWHWPILIFPAALLGHQLEPVPRLALAVAAVAVGALSHQLVEHPIRTSRWLSSSSWRSLTLGAVSVVVSLAVALAMFVAPVVANAPVGSDSRGVTLSPTSATTAAPPRGPSPAFLAEALAVHQVPGNLTPSLAKVAVDLPISYTDGCHLDLAVSRFGRCSYGDPSGTTTVVLIGDSHAAQWLPGLDGYARTASWKLVALTKSSCPASTALVRHIVNTGRSFAECTAAHVDALARVAQEKPELVVLSSMMWKGDDWQGVRRADWMAGVKDLVVQLRAAGARRVLWLGDVPKPGVNVPECLSAHPSSITACVTARSVATSPAVERELASAVLAGGGTYESVSRWFCVESGCPVIVGNVLVYRDDSHLTSSASLWLADDVGAMARRFMAHE